MKILHVNTEKGWRGGEQQLFYLAKGLIERGIETVVACRKGEELEKRCKQEGIPTIPLRGNQTSDILRLGVIGKKFDLIHAHSAKAHTLAAFSKPFHKKKVIYTRRIDFPPQKNPPTTYKYKLTDVTVCVSQKVEKVLKEHFPNLKTAVIHSVTSLEIEKSIDPKIVTSFRNKHKDKTIIGTAAALTPQKNIPNLIEAAKIVTEKQKNTVFVVFGEGHLKSELKTLVEKLGLQDNFFFEGFKKDIHNYIKALDIFVLPSDNEGFSGSILNAMLLKVPVIATDAGGAEEIIENEKTGLLVPRRNPVKLAHAILRLLNDEELKSKIVSNAYQNVVDNFTVDRMVDAYIKVYGEVVGDKSIVGKMLK